MLLAFIFVILLISHCYGECPPDTIQKFTDKSICFSFHVPESYTKAQLICSHEGGNLATIDSAFTNTFLAYNLFYFYTIKASTNYWVGGKNEKGTWTWVSGEPFRYSNWAPYEPNISSTSSCLTAVIKNARWYSDSCSTKKYFICEVPNLNAPSFTRAPPKNDTFLTLLPLTPTALTFTTTRSPKCDISSKNIFLTLLVDVGQTTAEYASFYYNFLTTVSQITTSGSSRKSFSFYTTDPLGDINFDSSNFTDSTKITTILGSMLKSHKAAPYSLIMPALINYEADLPMKLNYIASPIVIVFTINPVFDAAETNAKMKVLKLNSPKTVFVHISLTSFNPQLDNLPFDYRTNFTTNNSVRKIVDSLCNFICTVS